MSSIKLFTLAEANALIPRLKKMLSTANQELSSIGESLAQTYDDHELCQQEMDKPLDACLTNMGVESENANSLLERRKRFEMSIQSLSQAKDNYIETLNFWVEEISHTGVILRDIRAGLVDFPAKTDSLEYQLCWQAVEDEIEYWHLMTDGFSGRRPIHLLEKYTQTD